MERVRDHHFDNIKAILIFMVVLGHVISKFQNSSDALIIYKIIFSFHMPAFIFVSGYFAKYNPKRVLSKLFPLYLLFQIIQLVETMILNYVTTGSIGAVKIQFFKPEWTLWYLMALMIFQLLLSVFDTDDHKKQAAFIILALIMGLLIGLSKDTDNFMALSRVFVFLPFFLAGYYEKKNQILRSFFAGKYAPLCRIVTLVLAVFLIVIFVIYGPYMNARYFFGTDAYKDVYSFIWRILAWMIAFVWVCILLVWVPKKKLGYIGTIGSNTLPIYLFHSVVLLILARTGLRQIIGDKVWALVLVAVIITVALSWSGFEKMLRKIKIPQMNR